MMRLLKYIPLCASTNDKILDNLYIGSKASLYDKKFIIIGDLHYDKSGTCAEKPLELINSVEIDKYLEKFFGTSDIIDMFVEKYIPDKYSLISNTIITDYNNDVDYMQKIRNLFVKNYKTYPNNRIHFTDIRNRIAGFEKFITLYDIDYLLKNIIQVKEGFNLINLFKNQLFSGSLILLIGQIRLFLNNNTYIFTNNENLSEYLVKEINRFVNKKLLHKLLFKLEIKIAKYLDIVTDESYVINMTNIDDFFNLMSIGMDAMIYVTELYTILRIFKNDDIKKSILFVGHKHVFALHDYLDIFGIDITIILENEKPNIRCVTNVIEFNDFFQDKIKFVKLKEN